MLLFVLDIKTLSEVTKRRREPKIGVVVLAWISFISLTTKIGFGHLVLSKNFWGRIKIAAWIFYRSFILFLNSDQEFLRS